MSREMTHQLRPLPISHQFVLEGLEPFHSLIISLYRGRMDEDAVRAILARPEVGG